KCPNSDAAVAYQRVTWWDNKLATATYSLNGYILTRHGNLLSGRERGPGPKLAEIPRPADRIFTAESVPGYPYTLLHCGGSAPVPVGAPGHGPYLYHDLTHNNCADLRGRLQVTYIDGHAKVYMMRGALTNKTLYPNTIGPNADNYLDVQQFYPEW